jgi:hypothetical protein
LRIHPLAGALLTVLAVVAWHGGRTWLQLRTQDAKWREAYAARLSSYGEIPGAEAAPLFQENHPRCFDAASEWSLRQARFDERRYEACLDALAAAHWSDRVTLSGGEALEQDPFFPGSWRTYVRVSGDVPRSFGLRYEAGCDGEVVPGPSSNIFDRSSARSDGDSRRAELVIPKLFARRCTGKATLKVSPLAGNWSLGPPLIVWLPREAESASEEAETAIAQ